jgi:hypothetical protein
MLPHPTPVEFAVIWLFIALILVGVLFALTAIVRAILRKSQLSETARAVILSGAAAAVIAFAAFWVIRANSLDSLERDCRDHILAQPQMAGVSHLSADQHYDFWNYGASGGGFVAPWSVSPHTDPKVVMMTHFYRDDGQLHYASWTECLYKLKPDSGNPPQLAFDKVKFGWEYVVDEAGHHVGWHPAAIPAAR